MKEYIHSVSLDADRCTGCTTCMKFCPTEAIRVHDGCAQIDGSRCIDCGECVRHCTNNAKKAVCGTFSQIMAYKWKIALPAPSLMAQFSGLDDVDFVLQGLLDIGFDDVFEVACAAELVSTYTRRYLKTEGIKKPVIGNACPVVERLILLRFPSLRDNLLPIKPPVEVAAQMARERAMRAHPELKSEEIGVCFISPCAAKASYIKNQCGSYKSEVDVVLSINEVYFQLLNVMKHIDAPTVSTASGMIGLGWASIGGETSALLSDNNISVDGIHNVNEVLEKIENGSIPPVDFVELNACTGGCVGGVLTIENPYVAKNRLKALRRYMPVSLNSVPAGESYIPDDVLAEPAEYTNINRLGKSFGESMRMMVKIQQIRESLPGIDCGSCGAPTCRAFAEDVVRGKADINDCLIAYKEFIHKYITDKQRGVQTDDGTDISGS
ncbi:MAG: 4Fe-4S binding protein [Clostridia bacterium]|nr:4Fe-4S binding protein [Clostridia bacterium]